jgi:DNA mismatch repair ATPase MutS
VTYLFGIYNAIQTTLTYNKIMGVIHNKCNSLAQWLRGCLKLFNEHGKVLLYSKLYNEIQNYISNNKTVHNLLNHNTFIKEPSLFSNKGIILKVYKEFLDMKEVGLRIIEPFSEMLGIIDVWSSLAMWISDQSVPKCYSLYIENTIPKVKGNDVWNICCNQPVMNGFDMLDKNIMLVTGPNSSGKSTYIKSVIINIILSQTVGVCSAREFELTPFHNITTYLNIPDCNGKESLFQAEMNRCYEQLQILEKSEGRGELTFSIMDEIFVSTNYQEGMSGFYAILKKLEKYNKCLNIITTHFDVLVKMPELDVLKRYFDIDINDNGDIIRDYLVKEGVSQKHMALKLLKNKGFDAEIINDAEFMYNKLCNNKEDNKEKDLEKDLEEDLEEDLGEDNNKNEKLIKK